MLNLDPSQRMTSHFDKDQAKADLADKFIGSGSPRSSTHAYALAVGNLANTGSYTRDDTVMISAEGNRAGRVRPDFAEIQLAPARLRGPGASPRLACMARGERSHAWGKGSGRRGGPLLADGPAAVSLRPVRLRRVTASPAGSHRPAYAVLARRPGSPV